MGDVADGVQKAIDRIRSKHKVSEILVLDARQQGAIVHSTFGDSETHTYAPKAFTLVKAAKDLVLTIHEDVCE